MTCRIITTYSSFDMPLREAGRKQIFSRAIEYSQKAQCEIICINDLTSQAQVYGSISIHYHKFSKIIKDCLRFSQRHEIEIHSAMFQFKILLLVCLFDVKSIYLYDGEPLPRSENMVKTFARWIAYCLARRLVKSVCVLSNYQMRNLGLKKIKKIQPSVPRISTLAQLERSSRPSILYMGHLSKEKGCDTIIEMMELFANDNYDIKLVIADNSIHVDERLQLKLRDHLQKWDNVSVKGVVDPLAELSRCWVYLYPFTTPHGTMAFSLSIHEAIISKRPVIACDVGANREFFPDINFIPMEKIGDASYMMQLVKSVIENEK